MSRIVQAVLGVSVLILLAGGLAVLASAGSVNGIRIYSNPNHFLVRQSFWLFAGLCCLFVASRFDYHKWSEYPWLMWTLFGGVVVLLVAVLFAPAIKGSHRWLGVGSFRIQPSELAKLAVVVCLSVYLDRLWSVLGRFKKIVPWVILFVGFPVALALKEPDFGAAMVMGLVGAVLCIVAGMKILHLGVIGGLGACGAGVLLFQNANRMNRILSWLKNMFGFTVGSDGGPVVLTDKEINAAHQLKQALVAIHNGGVTGVGYNESMQKCSYLPEAHTDFIFAIGAEELGLVFSLALLTVFVVFFVCGVIISARAPDRLGRLLAYGMTFLIFFQAMFNIAVVTGCAPTKGIALPFISYGGTNLLTALIAVGVLFNVARQIELPKYRPRSTISPVFSTEGV